MIAGLTLYPTMKPSGFEPLGEVPAHWDVRPISGIGQLSKGHGGSKEDESPSGIPCVRYGDLYSQHEFFIDSARFFVTEERALDYTAIRYGDVLFASSGETFDDIGKSAVNLMDEPIVCGGDVIVLRPAPGLEARFLGYALDAQPTRDQKAPMGRGFTVVHIYPAGLKRVRVAIPPPQEQAAIVRFLDHADAKIRRHMDAKRRLIVLLEEQKQTIAHEAVTRGLDPAAQLKPSGVSWLGDVPEHWVTYRSKQLFRTRKELARPDDVQLSATQAYGVIPQAEYERRIGRKVTRVTMHLEKRRHVEAGDFVISMRSFQGGIERAWASGCVRSSYVVLEAVADVDTEYFSYLFKSHGYIGALQSTANFIRDGQDLTFSNFAEVGLALPPIDEQKQIAREVAASLAAAVAASDKARREIELLREYRTRLIADVVTGRLDVREAAARLPREIEQVDHDEEVAA